MPSALILKAVMNVNVNKDMKKLTQPTQAVNVKTLMNVSLDNFLVDQMPIVLILKEVTRVYVMMVTLVTLTPDVNHLVTVLLVALILTVKFMRVIKPLVCVIKDSQLTLTTLPLVAVT